LFIINCAIVFVHHFSLCDNVILVTNGAMTMKDFKTARQDRHPPGSFFVAWQVRFFELAREMFG